MRYSPGIAQFYDNAPWPDDAQNLTADQVQQIERCLLYGGSIDTSTGTIRPLWTAEALAALKAARKGEADQQREQAIDTATVRYAGHTYQADRTSAANVTGAIMGVSAGLGLPAGFAWRTNDNVNVPFTATDLIALGGLMLTSTNAIYQHAWALKAAIDAAATPAEVDAAQW